MSAVRPHYLMNSQASPLVGSLINISYLLGRALVLLALAHAVPVYVGFQSGERTVAFAFSMAAVVTGFVGGLLVFTYRDAARPFRRRDLILLPIISFPVLAFFAGISLRFCGTVPHLGEGFFEALSGLTTTGASVLANVETAPKAVLVWRAVLEWLGGLMVIALALVIAPVLGAGGARLTVNALPHGETDSLIERFRGVVPALLPVYMLMTFAALVALWIGGLPAFDAFCHAMATVSTGGFSTRSGSLAAFEAPWAEVLIMPFMVMAAMNGTYLWALSRGRYRQFLADREVWAFLILVALGALVVATGHMAHAAVTGFKGALDSIRAGLFAAVSAASTTGFTGHMSAPLTVVGVYTLSALVFVGGALGSAAGGMKTLRFVIMVRRSIRELQRMIHPSGARPVRVNKRLINEDTLLSVWCLYFLFLSSMAVFTVLFTATGATLSTSFFLSLTGLSNAGPIIYTLDANFAGFPALGGAARALYAVAMLVGRVELLALLTAFTAWFWRN